MTDNPHFETPLPALADVQLIVDDFRDKLASTRKGSPLNTSEKNHSRQLLESELKKLAFYVNTVANGALHIVLSSGFPAKQLRTSMDIPLFPERLRLLDTPQSGQLRFDFNMAKSAWEYEYSYATFVDDNGIPQWGNILTTTSSRNNIIAPLEAGSICRVRVRSRNGKGVSDWSEPVSRMAR
ncbi:fibronectin type III domain-containing protein [Olivibacter domesticus]|nr:fibronectin type III domain-containing protein [Olivibacter domesticus]